MLRLDNTNCEEVLRRRMHNRVLFVLCKLFVNLLWCVHIRWCILHWLKAFQQYVIVCLYDIKRTILNINQRKVLYIIHPVQNKGKQSPIALPAASQTFTSSYIQKLFIKLVQVLDRLIFSTQGWEAERASRASHSCSKVSAVKAGELAGGALLCEQIGPFQLAANDVIHRVTKSKWHIWQRPRVQRSKFATSLSR